MKRLLAIWLVGIFVLSVFSGISVISGKQTRMEKNLINNQSKTLAGPNLVGEWHFDENKGTIAHDNSGNSNTGTIHGATWVTGFYGYGYALQFDGSTNYVNCGESTSLEFGTGEFSVVAWIWTSSSAPMRVVSKGEMTHSNPGWEISVRNRQIRVSFQDSTHPVSELISNSGNYADSTWHQIAFSRAIDGTVTLYGDGNDVGNQNVNYDVTDTHAPLTIGNSKEGSSEYFNGKIDEVRIYNCAIIPSPTLQTPSAPLNLQATSGNAQIKLTWKEPNSDGDSAIINYKVYRGTTNGGEGTTPIATPTSISYTDTGLKNGQIYYYNVSAISYIDEGTKSSEVSATPVGPPSAPQNLQAVPGNGQVELTWVAPVSDGGSPIINYIIYWGTASGSYTNNLTIGNITAYNITGLTAGVTYYFTLSAVNALWEGAKSNETSATPITTPSEPQNLQAASGNTEIMLTWQAPTSDGGSAITNYIVYWGISSGIYSNNATIGNITAYTVTGLTNGVNYYFAVSAKNIAGEGPKSLEVNATPIELIDNFPSITVFSPNGGENWTVGTQQDITWLALDDKILPSASINISLSRDGGSSWETIQNGVENTGTFQWTVMSPTSTQCLVKISVYDSKGQSVPDTSNSTFTVCINPLAPPAPTNLKAVAGDHEITLTWDVISDALEYRVYRSSTSGQNYSMMGETTQTSYTDTGLTNDATYYYQVSAVNSAGEGNCSTEISAIPKSLEKGDGILGTDCFVWVIPIIILLVILFIIFVIWKRKKPKEEPEPVSVKPKAVGYQQMHPQMPRPAAAGQPDPVEQTILDFIKNHPGAEFEWMARILELRVENLQKHMINLVNLGLITSVETEDGDLEYYIKGTEPKEAGFYKTSAKTNAPFEGEYTTYKPPQATSQPFIDAEQRIINFIKEHPGTDLKIMARVLDLRIDNLQNHMARLIKAGYVITVEAVGRDAVGFYIKGTEPKKVQSQWTGTKDDEQTKRQESERLKEEVHRLQRELDLEKTKTREITKFDSYGILGLTSNANREEVKEAYRKASKKWHPDKFEKYKDPQVAEMANKKYIEIQKAYEEIKKEHGW